MIKEMPSDSEEELKSAGQNDYVGPWIDVESVGDIDEEDTTGINILNNNIRLCKKLERSA